MFGKALKTIDYLRCACMQRRPAFVGRQIG